MKAKATCLSTEEYIAGSVEVKVRLHLNNRDTAWNAGTKIEFRTLENNSNLRVVLDEACTQYEWKELTTYGGKGPQHAGRRAPHKKCKLRTPRAADLRTPYLDMDNAITRCPCCRMTPLTILPQAHSMWKMALAGLEPGRPELNSHVA